MAMHADMTGSQSWSAFAWKTCKVKIDGWSVFDTLIVSVSVALLAVGTGGGNSWIKQLRVVRAFRLFRLLGKLGDLKKIVTAVAMSIAPTLQALLIGLIVIFIYAVFGLQFFADRSAASFGTFIRAVVTLFGVVSTLQPWPDDLPLLIITNVSSAMNETGTDGPTTWELDIGVIVFSFSFTVICLLILVQVVVAVLLDKFFQANQKIEEETIHSTEHEFDDKETLDTLLDDLFCTFDVDCSGSLSFTEFAAGLNTRAEASLTRVGSKKKVAPKLEDNYFSSWSAESELDAGPFKSLMLLELRKYLQRNTRRAERTEPAFEVLSTLQATRIMMIEQTKLQEWLKAELEIQNSALLRQQVEIQDQQKAFFARMEELIKGPGQPAALCDTQKSGSESAAETARFRAPLKSEPSGHQFLESLFGGSTKQTDASWTNGSGDSALQVVRVNQEKKRQDTEIFSSASPSMNQAITTSEDTIFPQAESPAQIKTSAQLVFQNPGNFDVLQWCFADAPKQK